MITCITASKSWRFWAGDDRGTCDLRGGECLELVPSSNPFATLSEFLGEKDPGKTTRRRSSFFFLVFLEFLVSHEAFPG